MNWARASGSTAAVAVATAAPPGPVLVMAALRLGDGVRSAVLAGTDYRTRVRLLRSEANGGLPTRRGKGPTSRARARRGLGGAQLQDTGASGERDRGHDRHIAVCTRQPPRAELRRQHLVRPPVLTTGGTAEDNDSALLRLRLGPAATFSSREDDRSSGRRLR